MGRVSRTSPTQFTYFIESKIITSKQYSIVSRMAFEIYAQNHDLNVLDECLRIDKETYYGMNILDYLVGNIDRHPENWEL